MFGSKHNTPSYDDYEEMSDDMAFDDFEYEDEGHETDLMTHPENYGLRAVQSVDNVMGLINNVTLSIRDYAITCQKVKYEIARMDHELDKFIEQSKNNLEKFKSALPVLNNQLTTASARIDKITDKLLDNAMDASSDESIQRHRLMLDLLTSANDGFNNLLAKLISL